MTLDTTIGGAASDSYVTLAEFQAYWTARGVDLTQHGHDESHEADLRNAAQFIDLNRPFVGMRSSATQSRAWPRYYGGLVNDYAVASDTIPQAIKDAQCEMAYIIHEGANPFAVLDGVIESTKVKAGPVETETVYQGGKGRPKFTAVDMLLRPYVTGGDGQVRLYRS